MDALLYVVIWLVVIFFLKRGAIGQAAVPRQARAAVLGDYGEQRYSDLRPLGWVLPERAIDPICSTTIKTSNARVSLHEGVIYYFCSRECRERFEAAPALYLGP